MSRYNISTKFLLPILKFSIKIIEGDFPSQGYINSYINCNVLKYPYNVLYLLFRPKELDLDFYKFHKELSRHENYIETYDLGSNLVFMIFRIPKEFDRDFSLFLEGQYSKTSKNYQKLFPSEVFVLDSNKRKIRNKHGGYIKEPSSFYHIFNKTEYLKDIWREKLGYEEGDIIFEDIELYEKQNIIKETFVSELRL